MSTSIPSTRKTSGWTDAYTDGSAVEATRDGGRGILIKFKDKRRGNCHPTGKYSSNYRAEVIALQEAAKRLVKRRKQAKKRIVIFTDALSVLQALNNAAREDHHFAPEPFVKRPDM